MCTSASSSYEGRIRRLQQVAAVLSVVLSTITYVTGAPPTVPVVEAVGRSHTSNVDLPGTTVMGFETTKLESKIGGYVQEITSTNTLSGATEEIDIGSKVSEGQVLAVLDAPELTDDLMEKKALLLQAESDVVQAEAGILQALAKVTSAQAAWDESRTELQEKQALQSLAQAECDNQQKLYGSRATTRELLMKAQSQMDAASAALGTVNARTRTAAAMIKAAEANVKRAQADKKHAEAGVAVARATIQRAETMIGYTKIRAPFDGLITKRAVDHGTFVRPAISNSSAMPLFEVTRSDKVRLVAKVPMARAQSVRIGQTILFHSVGGLGGATVEAEISRASAILDTLSRMLEIHVYVDNPAQDAGYTKRNRQWVKGKGNASRQEITLQPGMFGTATILETWDNLAIVPTTAIGINETGNHYVLRIDSASGTTVCRRQAVDVVFNDAAEVGISAGLTPGEKIVARSLDQYVDGQEVIVAN